MRKRPVLRQLISKIQQQQQQRRNGTCVYWKRMAYVIFYRYFHIQQAHSTEFVQLTFLNHW